MDKVDYSKDTTNVHGDSVMILLNLHTFINPSDLSKKKSMMMFLTLLEILQWSD